MEFRVCVVLPVFLLCLVHISIGLPAPKDDTLVRTEELIVNNEHSGSVKNVQDEPHDYEPKPTNPTEETIPGRVRCQYGGEEPIEDEDCQRHCLPKGFTYGLCFNNICSCA